MVWEVSSLILIVQILVTIDQQRLIEIEKNWSVIFAGVLVIIVLFHDLIWAEL